MREIGPIDVTPSDIPPKFHFVGPIGIFGFLYCFPKLHH